MAIGHKMGSLKSLKKSLEKGGGDAWIKYIPKNASMNVRFIEEPENWVNYVEHYDPTLRKSYPCNGEQGCPGCQTKERKSSRYLANAINHDDGDRVIPLQMPKDLANRLVVRYERNGTLIDRDFELSRAGEGLDTTYDLDAGAVDRQKIDKFEKLDLLKVLQDAYDEVFGEGDEDDDEDDEPVVSTKRPSLRAKSTKPAFVDADDEDEEDEAPAAKPAARRKPAAKAKPPVDEDDDEDTDEDPWEGDAKAAQKKAGEKPTGIKRSPGKRGAPEPDFGSDEDDDEAEEEIEVEVEVVKPAQRRAAAKAKAKPVPEPEPEAEEEYDEDSLTAMPLGALRAVAREFGVDPRGMKKDQIVAAILDAGDPVDDEDDGTDEPPF